MKVSIYDGSIDKYVLKEWRKKPRTIWWCSMHRKGFQYRRDCLNFSPYGSICSKDKKYECKCYAIRCNLKEA